MEDKKETIIDGVKITQDGDVTHFECIEDNKKTDCKKEEVKLDNRPWYEKLSSWWDNLKIKPYFKFRDLANPFGDRTDCDAGCDGKTGAEVGIQIKF